jgi:hypothetical protein
MDGKTFVALAFDFNTEVAHDGKRHVNVGPGIELSENFDFNWSVGIGRHHQKSRQKL